MPKPTPRLPQAGSSAAAAQPAPQLAPAPDNGVPYSQQGQQPTPRPPIKRNGKQLGARIPPELYDRLVACAEATRIPQGRLLERALDVELKSHGF